jgi:hypothetical protein
MPGPHSTLRSSERQVVATAVSLGGTGDTQPGPCHSGLEQWLFSQCPKGHKKRLWRKAHATCNVLSWIGKLKVNVHRFENVLATSHQSLVFLPQHLAVKTLNYSLTFYLSLSLPLLSLIFSFQLRRGQGSLIL